MIYVKLALQVGILPLEIIMKELVQKTVYKHYAGGKRNGDVRRRLK